MKKLCIIVLVCLLLSSCGSKTDVDKTSEQQKSTESSSNTDESGKTEEDAISKIKGTWVCIEYAGYLSEPYTLKEYYFDGKDTVNVAVFWLSESGITNVFNSYEEGTYYVNEQKIIYADFSENLNGDTSDDWHDEYFDYFGSDENVLEMIRVGDDGKITRKGEYFHRIDADELDELIEDLRDEGTDIIEEKYSDFVYTMSY
jgi:hypothetical protein